jgi:hypothetical protein
MANQMGFMGPTSSKEEKMETGLCGEFGEESDSDSFTGSFS